MPFTLTYKAVWFFDAIMINCELVPKRQSLFCTFVRSSGWRFLHKNAGRPINPQSITLREGGKRLKNFEDKCWHVPDVPAPYSHRFGFPYSLPDSQTHWTVWVEVPAKESFPKCWAMWATWCQAWRVRVGTVTTNEQYKMVEKSVNKQRDRAYIGRSRYCTCRLRQRT